METLYRLLLLQQLCLKYENWQYNWGWFSFMNLVGETFIYFNVEKICKPSISILGNNGKR